MKPDLRIVTDQILRSQEFDKAKQYQKLLRYVAEASLKGHTPKEAEIAVDVFGKEEDFDPEKDASVRVYISNLRKKLDSYYQHEGQHDPYKIFIPKGSYTVELIRCEQNSKSGFGRTPVYVFSGAFILALAVCIYILFSHRWGKEMISGSDPVWGGFLDKGEPVQLVLGDFFFFRGEFEDKLFMMRKTDLNKPGELDSFLVQNPAFKPHILKTSHSYLTKLSPWAIAEIAPLLTYHHVDFELNLSSQVRWKDLQGSPLIYIGTYRTLGIIHEMLSRSHFEISAHDLLFTNVQSGKNTLYSFRYEGEPSARKDYALVAKLPGPDQKDMLLFLSLHDIGIIAAVKHFCDKTMLGSIEERLDLDPEEYFEVLFEVRGYERTDFEATIVDWNVWAEEPVTGGTGK